MDKDPRVAAVVPAYDESPLIGETTTRAAPAHHGPVVWSARGGGPVR